MVILGLLLLLSAAGLAVDMAMQNTSSISVDAVGQTFSLCPGWLFVAGIAAGAIALLPMVKVSAGVARRRRRRAALVESKTSLEGLQAERDRLAVQLERERAGRTSTPAVGDRESAVIDLADERQSEPARGDYAGGRAPSADRREPVGSGRRGIFNRRH